MQSLFQRYLPALDSTMQSIVTSQANQPDDFGIMLRYTFGWVDELGQPTSHPTGKRIRPILLLICSEAAGGNWKTALPAAAAVEILHNFSLIHDDIQDDSPIRHNRPTVWKVWGRPNAINAGDALFTLSYQALHQLQENGVSPNTILQAWQIFNATALELTRGQHLDMRFEHTANVTVEEYISMITGKSAALIAASAQMGAFIATDDLSLAQHYAEFGLNLGIAFQIRDDILGIWGDPQVTGKSVATDILSRKKSLPILYGLAQSPDLVSIYQREPFTENDVSEAVEVLNRLEAQQYASSVEKQYYDRALAALNRAQPQGAASEWLQQLIHMLFQRSY